MAHYYKFSYPTVDAPNELKRIEKELYNYEKKWESIFGKDLFCFYVPKDDNEFVYYAAKINNDDPLIDILTEKKEEVIYASNDSILITKDDFIAPLQKRPKTSGHFDNIHFFGSKECFFACKR